MKSSDVEIQPCSSSKLPKLVDDELISDVRTLIHEIRPILKLNDIPKVYGIDKEKVDEVIYLVETEAED